MTNLVSPSSSASSSFSSFSSFSSAARNAKLRASVPFGAQAFWLDDRLFVLTKICANHNTIALPDGSYLPTSALSGGDNFRTPSASADSVVSTLPAGAILAGAEEVN